MTTQEAIEAGTQTLVDTILTYIDPMTYGADALVEYLAADEVDRTEMRANPPSEIIARFVAAYTARQELDCIDWVFHHEETYQKQADRRGRSKPGQWKAMKRLKQHTVDLAETTAA